MEIVVMCAKSAIVGFGIVGKSYLRFLSLLGVKSYIWDSREPSKEELRLIEAHGAILQKGSMEQFIADHDHIYLSPGIKVEGSKKFICELDLFQKYFKKPVVAITGSLGKTSITCILEKVLNGCGVKAMAGGNVGYAMLDLIDKQGEIDIAILELSSFQLERSRSFAPDIAILSNFYPNHLDRHGTMELYLNAKLNIFRYQHENQFAILPYDLEAQLVTFKAKKLYMEQERGVAGKTFKPETLKSETLGPETLAVVDGYFMKGGERLFRMSLLPSSSFVMNWKFVLATLSALSISDNNISFDKVEDYISRLNKKEIQTGKHRLELFATINEVDFYNDSKATVIEATLAALKKLQDAKRPITLILGGLGKGVDRSWAMDSIKGIADKIVCFGETEFDCKAYESLESTVSAIMEALVPGRIVLFSPGGASFDFFKNFRDRGDHFKELVMKYGEKKLIKVQPSNISNNC